MSDDETTAAYLARRICEEKGYTPGTVPEAAGLAEASDFVLTLADGLTFQVVCIVDAEKDDSRRFPLLEQQIVDIASACSGYTGRMAATKMPVSVQIWEVGAGRQPRRDLSRRFAGRAGVVISCWGVDTAARRVTCTFPWNGFFAGRPLIERLLREPRRSAAEAPSAPALADTGRPVATIALLAALVLGFAGELIFGLRPSTGLLAPDITTLIASGGLLRMAVAEGQWWRLLIAPFLHGDALHLLLNGVALFLGGVVLEGLVGSAWTLALFIVGGLGGGAASLALNGPEVVSVGASGAIMGVFAAAVVLIHRLPSGPERSISLMSLLRVLIPSLIPLATHRSTGHIDFAAHLGGAVAGALAGLVLLRTWPTTNPRPRAQPLAWTVTVLGAIGLFYGLSSLARERPDYVQGVKAAETEALLIPNSELAGGNYAALIDHADDLLTRYPRDPRAHLMKASALDRDGKSTAAQAELRRALEERDTLTTNFADRGLESDIRAYLADLLVADGKTAEAATVVAPVCHVSSGGPLPPVAKLNLCP